MSRVNIHDMLKIGVHFGHQTRYWNPKVGKFTFGTRNKIHIIDLEKTLPMFNEALTFVKCLAAGKNKVPSVGAKCSVGKIVHKEAAHCGVPHVDYRWLGGMLTNYKTIRQSIKRLRDLETQSQDGTLDEPTKKKALMRSRDFEKLERNLGGIKDMGGLPDTLLVIDVNHERITITEANKLGILVIGVVDIDSGPEGTDYAAPDSGDAIRTVQLYLNSMTEAIIHGKQGAATSTDESVEEAPIKPAED